MHKFLKFGLMASLALLVTLPVQAKDVITETTTPVETAATAATAQTWAESEANAAFQGWLTALSGGKPEAIVALYATDATLEATLAPMPLTTQEARLEYFTGLMKKPELKATVQQQHVRSFGDVVVNSGVYTFSFKDDKGAVVEVPARFSFTYHKANDGTWLIVDHHSSKLPESH